MIPKQDIIELFQKEVATTLRVMRAYPEGKFDFSPHERSSNTMKLVSTFVFEMHLFDWYLFGKPVDRTVFQTYKPESMDVIIADFEKLSKMVLEELNNITGGELYEKTIEFGGAKFTGDKFAMMMIHDQIHHRGQLTVYTRMAGGKVPSIYGPSADDSTTNL